MRYWPLSTIAKSPRLHHSQVWELMCVQHVRQMSDQTLQACNYVAGETVAGSTSMVLVPTEGAISRCQYLRPPTPGNFAQLERAGFVATEDTFGFVIDTLH